MKNVGKIMRGMARDFQKPTADEHLYCALVAFLVGVDSRLQSLESFQTSFQKIFLSVKQYYEEQHTRQQSIFDH